MSSDLDEILDDPFHGAAWIAFVEIAAATGRIPDLETSRRLAYRYYEEALAEKNTAQTKSAESG